MNLVFWVFVIWWFVVVLGFGLRRVFWDGIRWVLGGFGSGCRFWSRVDCFVYVISSVLVSSV